MLTAILLLAAAAAPAKVAATPIFAETPTGWRMGKATARAKLVEYGSLNCSHCANFSGFASGPIAAAVRAGRASFEFRPYLIFPHDVAATLIALMKAPASRYGRRRPIALVVRSLRAPTIGANTASTILVANNKVPASTGDTPRIEVR